MHCFALFGTFKPLEKALGALITHLHVVDFHESSAKLSTATCLYPLNCIRLHRFGKLNYLVGRPFSEGKLLLLKAKVHSFCKQCLHKYLVFINWQPKSALASLERFGKEYLVLLNWRSCRHCLQNEWPLIGLQQKLLKLMYFSSFVTYF